MGADVVKVEPPGGDPMRAFPDLFATLVRHKQCIELDLHDPTDRTRALDLAAASDIAVEGFRPGVASRLGIDYDALRARHPAIVYCSISGYGQRGPRAPLSGHDVNYQAYAGVLAPRTGDIPTLPGLPYADLAAGLAAAMAMCAAYVRRLRSGEGEFVDVSMTQVLAHWNGAFDVTAIEGSTDEITGNPGYGLYVTAEDEWVSVGVTAESHFWSGLCEALDLPAFAGLSYVERVRRHAEVDTAVARAIARLPRAEAIDRLERHGVPVAPVLTRRETLAALGREAITHPVGYRSHPSR
jgi:crotonobetainyl-CoA:carnitine CoA-transferase CaiB-like acyl-CoA transferase